MTVRERTQETEDRILSPFAALSGKSRGAVALKRRMSCALFFSVTETGSFTASPFAALNTKRRFFFLRKGTITVPG